MTVKEVAENLGKGVRYVSARHGIDGIYTMTAYILRRDRQGRKIQSAELTDGHGRVMICRLEEVEAIEEG